MSGKNVEHLMEEWKELRKEGNRKQMFVERLLLTTIAGNLAIYSFAFSKENPSLLNASIVLLPVFLTTISYFWILRNLYSGLRCIKYIAEKIEPYTGLGWEKWLIKGREKTQTKGKIYLFEDIFKIFYHFFLIISPLLSTIIVALEYNNKKYVQFISKPLVFFYLWGFIIIFYFFVKKFLINPRNEDIKNLNNDIKKICAQDAHNN